jgi:MerR family transcriptional regulator, thiopeptide resistance regulator
VNKPKPHHKPSMARVLGASECAHRTGVTVRTLRVYERAGLLTPPRDAKGWRIYGERDIQRLNCIITLKTLGLTLREIRGVLSTAPPPLTEVLQLQLESWLARHAEAQRALALLRAALSRLSASHALPIEELCELIKSTEGGHSARPGGREGGNEAITLEEERAYLTWVAAHPSYARSMQSFTEAQHPLLEELEALRVKGVDPASHGVQAIVDRHSELMTRHGVRQLMVELMAWNPAVTGKYLALGERLRDRKLHKGGAQPDAPADPAGGFFGFLIAAQRASATARALRPILDEAGLLAMQGAARTSREAQQLAMRLSTLCRRLKLGCPLVFAQWAAFMARAERGGEYVQLDAEQQAPYRFLADAVRAIPARRHAE